MKKHVAVFVVLSLFLLWMGVVTQWPTTITPDAAMHAEIVYIIKQQGFITSWEPYAPNDYTYPPLFHYLSSMLPLEPIDAVRALGLVVWLLLPLSMYVLVETYNKRAAIVAAILVGLVPSFSNVFIYGEFPQLLGMAFVLLEWGFLRKKRVGIAGLFVGLTALTHIFFVLVAAGLYIIYLISLKQRVSYLALPVFVTLPWIHAYAIVVRNVLNGTWENTRYNMTQPVFSFWSWEVVQDWLFGWHGLTIVLVVLSVIGLFLVKDRVLRWVFGLSVFLTVFHVPFTQLKILDWVALPMVMLAALALTTIPRQKSVQNIIILGVVVFLAINQVNHVQVTQKWWLNPEIAPTAELTDAAQWLGKHDAAFSRVYVHQASAWGGILSRKYPLHPDITHLETFSDAYLEQLAVHDEIKQMFVAGDDASLLLRTHDVHYVIAPLELKVGLPLLYQNFVWGVYKV
jgi:hypothetical protein